MRVSTYTSVAPLPDERFALILHGVSGAFDKVERRLGEALFCYRGQEIDVASLAIPTDVIDRLTRRGYLTTASGAEEREALMQITRELHTLDLMRKVPSFSFVPTYMCNLRCPYCFQSHQMHAGLGTFGQVISVEQIDAAFAIIDDYWSAGSLARAVELLPDDTPIEPRDKWSMSEIGLFGGEPLLAATLTPVQHISDRAKERGLRLWGITNGVDLHHFADLLGGEPGNIAEIQVTVDGMPHHHNRRRLGPGQRGTFDAILQNIQLALDRGAQVNIRMNTDQANVDDIADLAGVFEAKGWSKRDNFEFYCAVVTQKKGPPKLDRYALVQRTLQQWQAGHDVSSYEQTARSLLQRLLSNEPATTYPFTGTAHCAAESGQIMFDARGDVFSCWEDVGQAELRIGTYDGDGLHLEPLVVRMWLERQPGIIDECSRCPYALIHTSGCGSQAREHSGTIYTNECESFQQYFPLALAQAYTDIEDKWLSNKPLREKRTLPLRLISDS